MSEYDFDSRLQGRRIGKGFADRFSITEYASDWDTPNIFTTSSALINKHSAMF